MSAKRCRCHSDLSLYGGLIECPLCGHWSNDPGIGCERRKCGWVDPAIRRSEVNRVTITLHLDLPDGVIPDVQYGTPPVVAATLQTMDEPPLPDAPPPDMLSEAQRIFEVKSAEARDPVCAVHGNTMKRWPAGVSKTKKSPTGGPATYNASWRCGVQDCTVKPIWDRDAA